MNDHFKNQFKLACVHICTGNFFAFILFFIKLDYQYIALIGLPAGLCFELMWYIIDPVNSSKKTMLIEIRKLIEYTWGSTWFAIVLYCIKVYQH
jgi:hypothetical protein